MDKARSKRLNNLTSDEIMALLRSPEKLAKTAFIGNRLIFRLATIAAHLGSLDTTVESEKAVSYLKDLVNKEPLAAILLDCLRNKNQN